MGLVTIHKDAEAAELTKNEEKTETLKCIQCQTPLFVPHRQVSCVQVLHCSAQRCSNYLCIECGWIYLKEYGDSLNMNGDQLYAKLSKELNVIFKAKERITLIESPENGNTDYHYKLMPYIDQDAIERVDNPQKEWNRDCTPDRCIKYCDHFLVILLCGLMYPGFERVWIDNEWHNSYVLVNSTMFIMIALGLRVLMVFELMMSFVISRVCGVSQSMKWPIRWTMNAERMFFFFGFILALCAWNYLWDMDGGAVRTSLMLFVILVCGPLGCVICCGVCMTINAVSDS